MQQDEVIWQVINQGHCSFKAKPAAAKSAGKASLQTFCRHEYNVTGLCNRSSCPLANSRYATIREHNGRLYLCLKTIERAHTPKKLWEKIRLPRNYAQALATIDKHLEYWPKFLVHKNKQRLTKITQYLIRMRKLAGKVRPKLITKPARAEKLEARRERKAEAAAKLDTAIEAELLERLKSGTYGDIYNFPVQEYEKALDGLEEEYELDEEEENEDERELEMELENDTEFVEGDIEDLGGLDDDDYEFDNDSADDGRQLDSYSEEDEDGLEDEPESVIKRRKTSAEKTKTLSKRISKRKTGRKERQFEVEEEHEIERPEASSYEQ